MNLHVHMLLIHSSANSIRPTFDQCGVMDQIDVNLYLCPRLNSTFAAKVKLSIVCSARHTPSLLNGFCHQCHGQTSGFIGIVMPVSSSHMSQHFEA